MAEFVIQRPEQGEPSQPADELRTMQRVIPRARRLRRPFYVFKRGGKRTRFLRRKKALEYFGQRLPRMEVGDVLVLQGQGDDTQGFSSVRVRRVSEPSVILPDQAVYWPEIQKRIYVFVMTKFPGVRWGGHCNCRCTRQGGSPSDHSCCNAGDFFPTSTAQGNEIERAVRREFGDLILYIAWQVALHYDHLHISTGRCTRCFNGPIPSC